MDAQQEMQRLKQAFKRREQKRQNVYIATVVDTTPRAESGYIVVQLKDGTQVYAHVWISEQIVVGSVVFVMPITHEAWNWFVVVGVNATTAAETVPYVQPATDAASLPVHAFDVHTGLLDWSRVSTANVQVDLTSQVQGVLPVGNQQPQTTLGSLLISVPPIAPGATTEGALDIGTNVAWVNRLTLTGGTQAKLWLRQATGALLYETAAVTTPFVDPGGYFLIDTSGSRTLRWAVRNDGGQEAGFTLDLLVIAFAASVRMIERDRETLADAYLSEESS